MEARQGGRPALWVGLVLLLALAMGRVEASRTSMARRMLQEAKGGEQMVSQSLEESKGIAVDPSQCALGQYSVAVKLTSVGIPKDDPCTGEGGSVQPFAEMRMGDKIARSKTLEGNYPAYLESLQFGCQDPANPVEVRVVNAANKKVCFRASLMDWANGARAAYTEVQEPDSPNGGFSLVKNAMKSFSYSMREAQSAATVDLSVLAYPGPMQAAQQWRVHTQGDLTGIVVGMLAFVGLVAAFVYRIRQGSAASASATAAAGDVVVGAAAAAPAPEEAAAAAAPTKTRQQGKLGVELRGADSA